MSAAQHLGLLSSEHPETLVLYTYSNSDTEYERNLHYFVEHGMADGDGCNYVIIVQEVSSFLQAFNALPAYLLDYSYMRDFADNPYANRTFCTPTCLPVLNVSCQCVLPCWTQCLLHYLLTAKVIKKAPSVIS